VPLLAVTGGAQGIGRAIALHFAAAGYAVSIADLAADAGQELVDKLRAGGAKALFVQTDVAQADQVERWLAATERELGCPDALVNNAGISRRSPLLDLTLEDFDRVIAVNLRGAWWRAGRVVRSSTSLRPAPSCPRPGPRHTPRPRAASSR
jgi:NAD(P)-dependent dehydrogenase (short-subunit alcohol dehydrogenase family)